MEAYRMHIISGDIMLFERILKVDITLDDVRRKAVEGV